MTIRLNKVSRDLNVGIVTVVEFLQEKGFSLEANPNTKISEEQYAMLVKEFSKDKNLKLKSDKFIQERQNKKWNKTTSQHLVDTEEEVIKTVIPEDVRPKFRSVGKIDLEALNNKKKNKNVSSHLVEKQQIKNRNNLNNSNLLIHFISIDAYPLDDEKYIRLSINENGYYSNLLTILYNHSRCALFYAIEEYDTEHSLYRILERESNVKLDFISELKDVIISQDNQYLNLLENIFNKLPLGSTIANKVFDIHSQLLYIGKQKNIELKWKDPNRKLLSALKTKPFIILSGISGTGKSSMVSVLARSFYNLNEGFGNKYTPNYNLQTVKPNWFDSTELLGYLSPSNQKFIDTAFLRFVKEAEAHPHTPYFVCLDEMNLARVELYFAEVLSKMETRCFSSEGLYSALPLLTTDDCNYLYPANLFIFGTVNMDDTTNTFSSKVLDRAMIFEMPIPNLRDGLMERDNGMEDIYYAADILLRDNIDVNIAYKRLGNDGDHLILALEEINFILKETPFKYAFRLRNEAILYTYYTSKIKDKPDDWFHFCLDEILCMKILPRLEGDNVNLKQALNELEVYAEKQSLDNAHMKISEMLDKIDKIGYTSYFN